MGEMNKTYIDKESTQNVINALNVIAGNIEEEVHKEKQRPKYILRDNVINYENDIETFLSAGMERDKKEINALKLYWRAHNDTLYAMSNHDALDGLATAIEALDPESDDFEEQLNEIIAMTKVYYENQRSTFSNIL